MGILSFKPLAVFVPLFIILVMSLSTTYPTNLWVLKIGDRRGTYPQKGLDKPDTLFQEEWY